MSCITFYLANFWFQSQVAGTKFRRVQRPIDGGSFGVATAAVMCDKRTGNTNSHDSVTSQVLLGAS